MPAAVGCFCPLLHPLETSLLPPGLLSELLGMIRCLCGISQVSEGEMIAKGTTKCMALVNGRDQEPPSSSCLDFTLIKLLKLSILPGSCGD